MSAVGDALSGSSDALSGVNAQTFSDATLGDQMQGGTGDFTGGDISASDAGGGGFQNFSNLANALSGAGSGGVGASPAAAQAASMTPPSAAAASGGDPVGAASGTQSETAPGSSPTGQNQQQQIGQNQNQQDQNQYAPKSATDQLKALLKQLSGKPPGPTGLVPQGGQNAPFALPTLAAGQTGAQSPRMPLPNVDAGETGAQSPGSFLGTPVQPNDGSAVSQVAGAPSAAASIPPGAAQQPAAQAERTNADGTVQTDAQGNPVTAAGTPAADTPLPPPRPGDQTADVGGGGRQITVNKQGQPLPTRVPHPAAALPTHKPGAEPAPEPPPTGAGATPRILQDISGASTGSPTALADLAQAARILLPLAGMLLGGGGGGVGRRGHRPGFQGMRGFRPFGAPGGFRGGGFHPGAHGHPAWRGAWPYHHPMHGWDMHHHHPGGGWLPLNPAEMQGMGGGQQGGPDPNAPPNQQGGPDPNRPPKETGAEVGPPDQVGTTGAIPGVSAKQVNDYTRQAASKWGIDPDVASKFLAQESSYGQAKKPGDNGTSFGPFQLHFAPDGRAMGDDFRRDTGLDPRDPSTWKDQVDYAMKRAAMGGWGPWTTTMNKLGYGQWSGITTNRRFAGQPRTNQQPSNVVKAAAIPTQLPPSSQPMVAGP
jgi:hypothetical protein